MRLESGRVMGGCWLHVKAACQGIMPGFGPRVHDILTLLPPNTHCPIIPKPRLRVPAYLSCLIGVQWLGHVRVASQAHLLRGLVLLRLLLPGPLLLRGGLRIGRVGGMAVRSDVWQMKVKWRRARA